MAFLSKDQILTADDLSHEDVEVPEWGGTVRVRTLTGTERDAFEAQVRVEKGNNVQANYDNMRAKLVARSLVDDKGERLFSDGDVKKLGLKNAAVLDRLFEVSQRLSFPDKEDLDKLAGNSEAAPSGSSTSD